jgi:hypothetical protein
MIFSSGRRAISASIRRCALLARRVLELAALGREGRGIEVVLRDHAEDHDARRQRRPGRRTRPPGSEDGVAELGDDPSSGTARLLNPAGVFTSI